MGKRNNPSPLQKANKKNPRAEPNEDTIDEHESTSEHARVDDLKRFITLELARTKRDITEQVKK